MKITNVENGAFIAFNHKDLKDSFMNEETIKNYKAIEKYVKDHSKLTDESQKLFEELLYNPNHPVEVEKIASQPDKRLFIEVEATNFEKDDESWRKFKQYFPTFIGNTGLSYKSYLSGKVGQKKLITSFIEYIIQDEEGLRELFVFLHERAPNTFWKAVNSYYPKNYEYMRENGIEYIKVKDDKLSLKSGRKTLKKVFNPKEVAGLLKEIKTDISADLNKEFFGVKRKNANYICFSLNFADWMLCSTAEEWSSCLSLAGGGYGKGLPGLVGDRNRIIAFITDKKEKEFNGIKSYRMFERCWLFLYKNAIGKKYLFSNKMYPAKMNTLDVKPYLKIFGDDIGEMPKDCQGKLYTSLYTFPSIFHKGRRKNEQFVLSSVYEDTHEKIFNPMNINECYYTINNGKYGCCWNYSFNTDGSVNSTDY